MNWLKHALTCNIMAAIYWIIGYFLPISQTRGSLTVLCWFLFSLPDMDLKSIRNVAGRKESKHRHWFWHSANIPVIIFCVGLYATENMFPVGLFCLVYGTHLLGDVKIDHAGKRGTYLIYVRKGDRMSRTNTDRYLIGNGVICITLAILGILL